MINMKSTKCRCSSITALVRIHLSDEDVLTKRCESPEIITSKGHNLMETNICQHSVNGDDILSNVTLEMASKQQPTDFGENIYVAFSWRLQCTTTKTHPERQY